MTKLSSAMRSYLKFVLFALIWNCRGLGSPHCSLSCKEHKPHFLGSHCGRQKFQEKSKFLLGKYSTMVFHQQKIFYIATVWLILNAMCAVTQRNQLVLYCWWSGAIWSKFSFFNISIWIIPLMLQVGTTFVARSFIILSLQPTSLLCGSFGLITMVFIMDLSVGMSTLHSLESGLSWSSILMMIRIHKN